MRTMAVAGLIALWSLASWVAEELSRAGELPQIIAFDGAELTGDHTHIVGEMRRLGQWDHSISSRLMSWPGVGSHARLVGHAGGAGQRA
jgi:hypothetical protein